MHGCPLIFQNIRLPELAPFQLSVVSSVCADHWILVGCRGFTGPVPPPLWI